MAGRAPDPRDAVSPNEPYRMTELRMSGQKQKQCTFNQIEPALRPVFHRALVTEVGAGQPDAGPLQKQTHELGDAEGGRGTAETALSKLRSDISRPARASPPGDPRCRGSSRAV